MDSISLLPSGLQNAGNYLVNLSGVPKNLINNDPAFYGTKSGPNGSTIVQLNIGGKLVRSIIVDGISVRLGFATLNLSGNLMDTNNNPLSNAEKQLWADQGWGRLDLGDFRKEIKKTELLKSGIEQRLATQKAAGKAKPVEQLSLDIVQPR